MLLRWNGYRRRLRARFDAWTCLERSIEAEPPSNQAVSVEEWAVYTHYRAILAKQNWEDSAGLAVWASKALGRTTPLALGKLGIVTILDVEHESTAMTRAFGFFEAEAKSVRIAVSHHPIPELQEVYTAQPASRDRYLGRNYVEESFEFEPSRPVGLREAELELFRDDSHKRPLLRDPEGLSFIGAPKGESQGQIVSREILRRLQEKTSPEDILVLVRSWDDEAEVIAGVARAWGLLVSTPGRSRRLASESAVSALLTAMSLPVMDWELAELIRLIRHGRFRPDWEPGSSALSRSRAASLLGELKVFRGRERLRSAIQGHIGRVKDRRDLTATRDLVDRLIVETEVVNQGGTWPEHVKRLLRLARTLGLGLPGDTSLENFWNAIEDHAAVLQSSGAAIVEYQDVVQAVKELVGEIEGESEIVEPGTVVITTVEAARGARAAHVILANLSEGTFPTKLAVEGGERVLDTTRIGPGFAREMTTFLGVIGSANRSLTLVYPCRDERGQEILGAGFLDELIRRFEPGTLDEGHHEVHTRFHPALIDRPDLARAPADARVRAMALACLKDERRELSQLAHHPAHHDALQGSASALLLNSRRFGRTHFDVFDGRIVGRDVGAALTRKFDTSYTFSPSQLESYLFCPFQFFMKYVLGLSAPRGLSEFDEDHIEGGIRIHEMLENLETLRSPQGDNLIDLVEVVIKNEMRVELTSESDSEQGRKSIEREIAARVLRRYARQADLYEETKAGEGAPRRHRLELKFGKDSPFIVGEGADAIRLQGTIDRVDLVEMKDGPGYRIIDYKTGSCPSAREVKNLEMIQLPIYALAVERLGLTETEAKLVDVGYWALQDKGYKAIPFDDWSGMQVRLEEVLIAVVKRLRSGHFEINPRKTDCMRFCDYKTICRIGQVRLAKKTIEGEAP